MAVAHVLHIVYCSKHCMLLYTCSLGIFNLIYVSKLPLSLQSNQCPLSNANKDIILRLCKRDAFHFGGVCLPLVFFIQSRVHSCDFSEWLFLEDDYLAAWEWWTISGLRNRLLMSHLLRARLKCCLCSVGTLASCHVCGPTESRRRYLNMA